MQKDYACPTIQVGPTGQECQKITKNIVCYFDGSCEPFNPGGDMGMGAVIFINQVKQLEDSSFIERDPANSNNVAEYLAFEKILDFLIVNDLTKEKITIKGDSKMVVNQMLGYWKIKSGMYTAHAMRCKVKLANSGMRPQIQWIPREQNAIADVLSKKAV